MVILSNAERLEQIKNKPHLFTSHDEQCADKNWLIEQVEENVRLREALEFYANDENHEPKDYEDIVDGDLVLRYSIAVEVDNGNIARQALEETK